MRPLIGITTRQVTEAIYLGDINNEDRWLPFLYGQFYAYSDAIVHAGGIPVLIPHIDDEAILRQIYEKCDGLLLCGGYDVDPVSYKADLAEMTICGSVWCDQQEPQLLAWALADDKPLLGICRGMQLINVALGGNLYQDIKSELPDSQDHQASLVKKDFKHIAHQLKVKPGSKLEDVLETDRISTNSRHHQAIQKLGDGLVATAHAEDGIIEAIEMPEKNFVIGVQSHPEELEADIEKQWSKLFTEFIKVSAKAG